MPNGKGHAFFILLDDDCRPSASARLLLDAAIKQIDPRACAEAMPVIVDGRPQPAIRFLLPSTHETFPAYAMKEILSDLKECIRKNVLPSGGSYRFDPVGECGTLELMPFVHALIAEHAKKQGTMLAAMADEKPDYEPAFRLPTGEIFTDAHGTAHEGLVDFSTIRSYMLQQERQGHKTYIGDYLDHLLLNDSAYAALMGEMTNGRPAGITVN